MRLTNFVQIDPGRAERTKIMAVILKFPAPTRIGRVLIKARERHVIWLRVADPLLAEVTRWQAQYAVQRGCGFRGLKGWTNRLARRCGWFRCKVRTGLLARFLLDLELVVTAGTLDVEVDGRPVNINIRPKPKPIRNR
jgi:hypothetical protein